MDLIATGICVTNASAYLGGAVAVIVYSTISNNKIKTILPEKIFKSALGVGLPASSITSLLSAYTSGSDDALATLPSVTSGMLAAVNKGATLGYSLSYR